jgi:RNA polymerase sigma factor (sigma-70 family)
MGYLRRTIAPAEGNGVSDAQLLERFIRARDEVAFELLVYRHGPMVFGVCRRVLRDIHDAEDAFQATMLVLARKADSISKWNSISSWLYKAAYRTALRAKAHSTKRTRFENHLLDPAGVRAPSDPADDLARRELRPVLDEELNRLPEKYRLPVVLCYLEGKTNEQAARQLQWPLGTVKTRLTKARELLCTQLARRGLTLSTALLVTTLSQNAASIGMPPALVSSIVQAAVKIAAGSAAAAGLMSTRVAFLTQGALNAMFMTKLKFVAAVVLAISVAGTGAGVLSYSTRAAAPTGPMPEHQPPPVAKADERFLNRLEADLAMAEDQLAAAKAKFEQAKAFMMAARDQFRYRQLILQRSSKIGATHKDKAKTDGRLPHAHQPVAYIFDKIPITRQDLGDYLIARAGDDKLEALVNDRIIEHACRQKGIEVTDADVEAALNEDLRSLGVTRQEFVQRVLSGYHKSLTEWKNDVIRQRLLLTKLCRNRVAVSDDDIRHAFETTHGEKVECRIILWPRDARDQAVLGHKVMQCNDQMFDALARKHPYLNPTTTAGHAVVIARHGTGSPAVRQ